jgi:hypothetical protein
VESVLPREPAPCRLSVFPARDAPIGAILRRGPSEWAQLTRWHRDADTFEPGQWFHGRVYERRCDLSPDGRLFIYFAAKHGPRRDDDDIGEAWTAIARPPYFTALALWRNLGSWYGGGAFRTDGHVLLDVACGGDPHPKFQPRGLKFGRCPAESAPWEQPLLRDGWQLAERGFDPRTHRRIGEREIWERPDPDLGVKLCRQVEDVDFRRYGGPHSDSYWLETAEDLVPLPGVTWADWDDGRGLVLVRGGRLYRATVDAVKLREVELYDFNPLRPEAVVTPDWARRW